MQEDADAGSDLLVCLGDLLRMAFERRENGITLRSELEFVGKYLDIEQITPREAMLAYTPRATVTCSVLASIPTWNYGCSRASAAARIAGGKGHALRVCRSR